MPLELSNGSIEVVRDFVSVIFAAYLDPYHPFVALLNPGMGSKTKEIFDESLHATAERLANGWKASQTEKWIKIVDTDIGEIVGVARWQIYEEHPFPNGPPYAEAYWLPENSRDKEYCNYIMSDGLKSQAQRCPMPHVWLNMTVTHPKHRRRGAASRMLQWGVDRANELNCEMFVEASWHGAQVYKQFRFIENDEYWTRKIEKETDEEWRRLEESYSFTAGLDVET